MKHLILTLAITMSAQVLAMGKRSVAKTTHINTSGTISNESSACGKKRCRKKIYKIKKGRHSSSRFRFSAFRSRKQVFSVKFNSSAKYDLPGIEQLDINKLKGFSDCGNSHQYNSARFGWRWNNNALEIFAYTYSYGNRAWQYMTSVPLDKTYKYSIRIDGNQYRFDVNGKTLYMNRGCSATYARGYDLYPYFGGNMTAPQEIKIEILH